MVEDEERITNLNSQPSCPCTTMPSMLVLFCATRATHADRKTRRNRSSNKKTITNRKNEQYKSVQDVTAVQRRLTPASLGSLAWGNNKLSFLAAGRPPKNLTIVTFRQNNQNKTNMDESKIPTYFNAFYAQ